ncbi:hypothetical protein PR001_g2085 [Phytophthora rubi]|uniref:Uncharacterized protein n=1 Tax=Phytophthora rubi TaxID=129364 RepID=A0A6A3PAU8_9STRA|nr:hypothetical protein PR001_g2085 [Phytophthora rubi]
MAPAMAPWPAAGRHAGRASAFIVGSGIGAADVSDVLDLLAHHAASAPIAPFDVTAVSRQLAGLHAPKSAVAELVKVCRLPAAAAQLS